MRAGVLLWICFAAAAAAGCSPSARGRPNIVFILADDLGYMDVAAYAARTRGVEREQTYYETPHIDQLVDRGVAFSQAYTSPLCSPTRAALLTGRYASRLGVTTAWFDGEVNAHARGRAPEPGHHPLDVRHEDEVDVQMAWLSANVLMGLPAGSPLDAGWDEQTLPELLPAHASAFVGKWHLGGAGIPAYQPHRQGFQRVLAHLDSGGSPYFGWQPIYSAGDWRGLREHAALARKPRLRGSWEGKPRGTYLTDELTDLAVGYLRERAEHPERPFLLFFSHFSVHGPFQARPEDVRYFAKKSSRGWNGHSKPVQAAMLKALDDSVGRIVKALALNGQLENTIVVFMSDNGGTGQTSHAPLRGGKGFINEGGIRVPLVVVAPGSGGRGWSDAPVHCIDLLPTLLELAGEPAAAHLDGRSFAAQVADPSAPSDPRSLYWHYPMNLAARAPDRESLPAPPQSAIRRGDYKLIWDWHGRLELYDVVRDIGEARNLAESEPEIAASMFRELEEWLGRNVERRYFPRRNPDYDASRDTRSYPFRDLREEMLGHTGPIGLPDAAGRNARAALE